MKQGRDKIISALSTVGKHTLSSTSPRESYEEIIKNSITYEEQIAAKKHEFVKKKSTYLSYCSFGGQTREKRKNAKRKKYELECLL